MTQRNNTAHEWWDVARLIPYKNNAKRHEPNQVKRIAKSIEKYGWRGNPILVDKHGVIIAGHGRRLAAISLGWEQVPVVVQDMTEEEAREFRLADNRAAEGGLDHDILREELMTLPEFSIDSLAGIFDKKELDFAVADIMVADESVFADNLDSVMDLVESSTDEKISASADKQVSLAKAFGFKSLKGSDVIAISHFIAHLAGKHQTSPEEALVAHAREVVAEVA